MMYGFEWKCGPRATGARRGVVNGSNRLATATGFYEMERVEGGLVSDLGHGAFGGGFVGAPADESGAVAEAVAREVVVLDFDDELGFEGFPL